MDEYCEACKEVFNNDSRFTIGEGKKVCEKCYIKFQSAVLEIAQNKENYRLEKLEEVLQHLKNFKYKDEYEALWSYIDRIKKEGSYLEKGNLYERSKTNIWVNYLKIICYIVWVLFTILFAAIGGKLSPNGVEIMGFMLGAFVGFVIGFASIAITMLFITLCENVSIINDNIIKLFEKSNRKEHD